MTRCNLLTFIICCLVTSLLLCGCVERRLTINTKPQGALVTLNDEEIGESPVTVNFNWYGDYCVRISKEGYETLNTHQDLKAAAVIAVEQVPPDEAHRYGVVSIKGAEPPPGEPVVLTDIIEKPPRGTAPSNLAVAARYVFSPVIFEALGRTPPDRQGEIQLTDAIKSLIQMGQPVYAWPMRSDQRRYDVGNFESYFRTFIDLVLADERYGYLARQYIKAKAYEL